MRVGKKMPPENAELTFGDNVLDTFIDQFNLSLAVLHMGRELICQYMKRFVPNVSSDASGILAGKFAHVNHGQFRNAGELR